ncbi:hypothetical protein [Brevundimonas subvibrioides]|uniref:hypothetical protein n=1 Tax=Brevundimonas subvibrioides TaxID=74313 RepID=UPI0022B5BEA1|nr:hypothetical protein [Brevundimonas subvibrioides]
MRVLAFVATFALSSPALAQTDDYEAVRSLPMEAAFAQLAEAENTTLPIEPFRFMVRRSLADLFYPVDLRTPFEPLTDADTVAAIVQFETKSGLVADGSLTFAEYEQLTRLAFLSRLTTLSPGMGFSVAVYDSGSGSIYASGSWSMPDMAFPLNRSEIVCQISEGFCSDKILNASGPSLAPSSTSTDSYTLSASEDIYEIKSWQDGILDAESMTDCRRVRLTINTVTKQVTQIAEDLDPLGCEIPMFGGRLDPIVGVRVATLIDSWDAQLAYRKTIQDRINQVAGPLQQAMSDMLPAD